MTLCMLGARSKSEGKEDQRDRPAFIGLVLAYYARPFPPVLHESRCKWGKGSSGRMMRDDNTDICIHVTFRDVGYRELWVMMPGGRKRKVDKCCISSVLAPLSLRPTP